MYKVFVTVYKMKVESFCIQFNVNNSMYITKYGIPYFLNLIFEITKSICFENILYVFILRHS